MATVKVSWSIDEGVAARVGQRATAESRSVSQMASLLLEAGLSEPEGRSGSAQVLSKVYPEAGSESVLVREAGAAFGSESPGAGLDEGDPGIESVLSADSPVPGLVAGSSSSSPGPESVLEGGGPSVGSGLSVPDVTPVSGSSSSSALFPRVAEMLMRNQPNLDECSRKLQHRKGEFCKSCGEMF